MISVWLSGDGLLKMKRLFLLLLLNVLLAVLVAIAVAGCQAIMPPLVGANAGLPAAESAATAPPAADTAAVLTATPVLLPTATPTAAAEPVAEPVAEAAGLTATAVPAAAPAAEAAAPVQLTDVFTVGNELTIAALLQRQIDGSPITIEQQLENGANYARYIASYISEGNKIYGLLTVPFGDPPEGGFKAIVFNHGYIPPAQYRTTERYVAYVDALARSGFVVFKIDLRGFGNSEGEPEGSYFSPAYTIDAISALKSLQTLDYVDPDGIGMWGHSMAGNLGAARHAGRTRDQGGRDLGRCGL